MKEIEIQINEETGEITIDNIGFTGPDCLQFTKALEEALGKVNQRSMKPEYHAQQRRLNRHGQTRR